MLTQMMFNIGFYLVVPFLAVYMTQSLAAGGAMIGLVLGLRTFSQQGLFFLGGGLTDRFGVKPVLLVGIAIRVIGFIVTGLSRSTVDLMIGVILIGVAAALFSPAAEAALADSGREAEESGRATRAEIFALDSMFSRAGALIGPILGAVLMSVDFALTCWVAAAIFTGLFLSHLLVIPAVRIESSTPVLTGWATVLRNRAFLVFAVAYSTYLVAYNQQYLSLPVELTRAVGHQDALGWMFVYSSVLILCLQMPVTATFQFMATSRVLGIGFGVTAAGFLVLAVSAPLNPLPGIWAYAPAIGMLTLLHLGQMIAIPVARDLVGVFAGERNLGAYFGFLNSFGGLAVLLSSLLLGMLIDAADTAQPAAALPWGLLAGMSAASAVALMVIARRIRA
nr:MFS transporter [Corynebacterium pacaense]